MHIRTMNATYGKLERAQLELRPGLNVIYAPNESGKSTWCSFIRNMFYGISTRDRGISADKNRYAPWTGSVMSGRMDLSAGKEHYTITRETRRAGAPMGEFSCVYSGTVTPVPGITGQNAGDLLLGVSREVFERSAFIGQSALAVDQDAELERRIAALITTGEENTSYSDTYDRLKKQLNHRRHNRTGQIPALEREIDQLDRSLGQLEDLQKQHAAAVRQLDQVKLRLQDLEEQDRRWEILERKDAQRLYREAAQSALLANQRLEAMSHLAGPLPDSAVLSRMELQSAALSADQAETEQARLDASAAAEKAREADEICRAHPLYPADEAGLRSRVDQISLPAAFPVWPFLAALAAGLCFLAGAALCFISHSRSTFQISLAAAGALCILLSLLWRRKRSLSLSLRARSEAEKSRLEQQIREYLPLRQEARDSADAAYRAGGLCEALCRRQEAGVSSLLDQLHPYRAVSDLNSAVLAIAELRRRTDALSQAAEDAKNAEMHRDLLRQHLPDGSEENEPAPEPPSMDRGQIRTALPQAAADLRIAQSRLDTLTGQIRSMGDSDDLIARRQQKQEELTRLQGEYDAIVLAMDALDSANLTLQNRFSPALGARAAEIFSGITGGKYSRVLLSRDFSLAAESAEDPSARSVQLLSQGTADQLYLSVRLAICDMVLPPDRAVPLILDDALVSFDDDRLHAALEFLLQESQRRQILLFSCQKREQDYLAGRENAALLSL